MTYEEFKEKFPVGSLFDVGVSCKFLGAITKYDDNNRYAWLKCDDFVGSITCCYKVPECYINQRMKPIFEIKNIQENKLCPRCSSEMTKKQAESYGLVDKCPNCGYC